MQGLLLTGLIFEPVISHAAILNMADEPLYLGTSVDPNVLFTLDNSGSMTWEAVPLYGSSTYTSNLMMTPQPGRIYEANGFHYSAYANSGRMGVPVFEGGVFTQNYGNFIRSGDVVGDSVLSRRNRSSSLNLLYYNPETTYKPWVLADGSFMADVPASCAPHNPMRRTGSTFTANDGCIDLTQNITVKGVWQRYDYNWTQQLANPSLRYPMAPASTYWRQATKAWVIHEGRYLNTGIGLTFFAAVYYEFDQTKDLNNPYHVWDKNNFTKVEIKPGNTYSSTPDTDRSNRTDCANAPICTYAEEIQNFANWYSYYRSRYLLARAAIGKAFAEQSTNMRVGLNYTGDRLNYSIPTPIFPVRPFLNAPAVGSNPAITNRDDFFTTLYDGHLPTDTSTGDGYFPAGLQYGTPLRKTLNEVHRYFSRQDANGPWGPEIPSQQISCRQNFHILMTDGFYNGSAPYIGNVDGLSGPNGYTPAPPFADAYSTTLADFAMRSWVTDLRTDLVDDVPANSVDSATWQHVATYTIGFGVNGTLDPVTDAVGINNGTTPWPYPSANNPTTVDDLWHAAVNGHGGYFSASNPESFSQQLSATLSSIANLTASSASVALNSGSTASGAKVYQARFNSGDWSGNLTAFPLSATGQIDRTNPDWDADSTINLVPWNQRRIFTNNGLGRGKRFKWSGANRITNRQKSFLTNKLHKYIRGNTGDELRFTGGIFRNRPAGILGDIVHSAPAFVGDPSFKYTETWDDLMTNATGPETSYQAFKTAVSGRTRTIYVGANDGMLHAFRESDGQELFAYIPNVLIPKLPLLGDPDYNQNHKYFVDGSPNIVDAYVNGDWKSVLVSNLRAGEQGIFALDVTNPIMNVNNTTDLDTKVLWEFTDIDYKPANTNHNFDPDLGYTFGTPNIIRLHNGKWAAAFGNGYNNTKDNAGDGATADSSTGNAVVYIVNLQNGNIIKKFDTGKGMAQDPTGNNFPNGIAGIAPVDIDGDNIADYIYGGDLFGNLWKFDITDSNKNNWHIANGGFPLFVACTDDTCTSTSTDNKHQPITSRPQVGVHPTGFGQMVYFGTGSYFKISDEATVGQNTQTFYGIWDRNLSTPITFTKADLLQQSIESETTVSVDTDNDGINDTDFDLRQSTNLKIDIDHWRTPPPNLNPNTPNYLGWYMDLIVEDGTNNNHGERQVVEAVLRNGKIIFITLLPSASPCNFGGDSWLMELDAKDGSRLVEAPFDLNGDGAYSSADKIPGVGTTNGVPNPDIVPTGKKSKIGIISTPGIAVIDSKNEVKLNSGSTGNLEETKENATGDAGRKSWIHLK